MGAITGIVIGVLLVLTPLAVLGCFIFLHRYSGIPRCCSCPRLTLVLEEGHPILHFRPGSPGPPHFPMDILSRPQFLPHLVLTCGSFLNTSFILLFSREVGSISFATPWTPVSMEFPGRNTGVGCHLLPQGIFLTQGSNPCLLHWQADSLPLSHQGSLIYQLTQLRPLHVPFPYK